LISKIKPTHIIHTAWETTHGAYWSSNLNFEWLVIGPHLLKVFAANGGEKFVSAGTLAEYDWSYSYFTEGVSPELPATIYGKAKKYHHDIMSDYSNALGVQYATGRIFYGYGPYENRARIIPYTFLSLLGGKSANLSPCDFYRDYLYIDDIADGFLKVLDSDFSGAINISSATPYLLADIMNTIGEVAERQDLINLGANQKRANDVNMLVGDNNILKSLGWKQRTNLTQGIQLSYQWWKDNYQ
jgi:nucleoside-diphosphate-sugar epimerase